MDFKIDTSIPMPDTANGWRARLDALEEGHSFSFPRNKRGSVSQVASDHFHSLTSKRFTISVKGQPKGMARVWRLKDQVEEQTA
jgi:hypothetical protein